MRRLTKVFVERLVGASALFLAAKQLSLSPLPAWLPNSRGSLDLCLCCRKLPSLRTPDLTPQIPSSEGADGIVCEVAQCGFAFSPLEPSVWSEEPSRSLGTQPSGTMPALFLWFLASRQLTQKPSLCPSGQANFKALPSTLAQHITG